MFLFSDCEITNVIFFVVFDQNSFLTFKFDDSVSSLTKYSSKNEDASLLTKFNEIILLYSFFKIKFTMFVRAAECRVSHTTDLNVPVLFISLFNLNDRSNLRATSGHTRLIRCTEITVDDS